MVFSMLCGQLLGQIHNHLVVQSNVTWSARDRDDEISLVQVINAAFY